MGAEVFEHYISWYTLIWSIQVEFQPWINMYNRYLETVMSEFITVPFPVNTHSFLWQDVRCQYVTSIYSDIFSSSITGFLSPTSRTHSGPSRFCVLSLWCFSHVFPSCLKDPHPLFCLIESSALSLRAQLKFLPINFSLPISGQKHFPAPVSCSAHYSHLAIIKTTTQYLLFYMCI